MAFFRGTLLSVALLLLVQYGSSFGPQYSPMSKYHGVASHMFAGKNNEEDPTKVWYAGLADGIQNLLTNSPLNEGKKALVQSLAGDYDKAATRAKLDGLIAEKPVLMLSFVK
jgi:hypothetical protein